MKRDPQPTTHAIKSSTYKHIQDIHKVTIQLRHLMQASAPNKYHSHIPSPTLSKQFHNSSHFFFTRVSHISIHFQTITKIHLNNLLNIHKSHLLVISIDSKTFSKYLKYSFKSNLSKLLLCPKSTKTNTSSIYLHNPTRPN